MGPIAAGMDSTPKNFQFYSHGEAFGISKTVLELSNRNAKPSIECPLSLLRTSKNIPDVTVLNLYSFYESFSCELFVDVQQIM